MLPSFINSLPNIFTEIDSFLLNRGFEFEGEETCNPIRRQLYYRTFKNDSSNVLLRCVLRFELCISDSPTASFDENHELTFQEAYLELWDRQMQSDDSSDFDTNTEHLRKIGNYSISPSNITELDSLFKILGTI